MMQYQVGIKYTGMESVIIQANSEEQAAWTWIRDDFERVILFEPDSILAVYHEVNDLGDIKCQEWELKFFLDLIESAKALAVLSLFEEKIKEAGE